MNAVTPTRRGRGPLPSVPSTRRRSPALLEDGERFAAYLAHELRTPLATQRALLANLVSNAIRHNVTDGRIEIATRGEPGRALLSIANTGPPVAADELHRLFQPFERLNSSPRSLSDGLGLGLAIVQAIADAHGAIVTAEARAGGGLAIEAGFPATRRTPR